MDGSSYGRSLVSGIKMLIGIAIAVGIIIGVVVTVVLQYI